MRSVLGAQSQSCSVACMLKGVMCDERREG